MYQYDYANLIDFDFATFQLVNRSVVDSQGFEVQLSGVNGSLFRWQLSAWQNENEVDGVDNVLLHRPEHAAAAWFYWTPNIDWELMFSAKYEGSRPSSSIPGGDESLPSYARFDVAVSRSLGKDMQLQLAVDNLFDEDYEVVAGFPSAGLQARVGLRKRF